MSCVWLKYENVSAFVWPWWQHWHELLCPAAGRPSQCVLPGLQGAEDWLPALSECWSLLRTAAALMQCLSGSFWQQCGEECSHSGKVERWTVTSYNTSLYLIKFTLHSNSGLCSWPALKRNVLVFGKFCEPPRKSELPQLKSELQCLITLLLQNEAHVNFNFSLKSSV